MYIKVLKEINQQLGQNINMQSVHLDFELASSAACLALYPDCEVKRCAFHLLQGSSYIFTHDLFDSSFKTVAFFYKCYKKRGKQGRLRTACTLSSNRKVIC